MERILCTKRCMIQWLRATSRYLVRSNTDVSVRNTALIFRRQQLLNLNLELERKAHYVFQ